MLIGSVVLGLLYQSGFIWGATAILDPLVKGWLGRPSIAVLALVFAFLRKELALQLLVALARSAGRRSGRPRVDHDAGPVVRICHRDLGLGAVRSHPGRPAG